MKETKSLEQRTNLAKMLIPLGGHEELTKTIDKWMHGTKPYTCDRFIAGMKGLALVSCYMLYNASLMVAIGKGMVHLTQ